MLPNRGHGFLLDKSQEFEYHAVSDTVTVRALMSKSTRFPVAVHILVALVTKRTEWLNSESLAWSIGTNASMVRRVLAALKRAGLVACQAGIAGGATLAIHPERITLLDVYQAVKLKSNIGVHKPNPECPMGAVIDGPLQAGLDESEEAVNGVLSGKTIAGVTEETVQRIVARRRK